MEVQLFSASSEQFPVSYNSAVEHVHNFISPWTIVVKWILSASNHVIPAFLSESFAPILGDQEYFWRAVSVMGVKMSILKQIPSSGIPRPQVVQG